MRQCHFGGIRVVMHCANSPHAHADPSGRAAAGLARRSRAMRRVAKRSGDGLSRTRAATSPGEHAAPFPFPPIPRTDWHDVPVPRRFHAGAAPREPAAGRAADDGSCPLSHPVKAKLTSGIYHVPGGVNYERTKPDRCYVDAAAAEADGLRAVEALTAFSPASASRGRWRGPTARRVPPATRRDDVGRHTASRWRSPSARPRRSGSGRRPCRRCSRRPRRARVPTRPIMPGVSSLCTTSMWRAGGRSTVCSSMPTMRGRLLLAEQRARDLRGRRPRRRARR